MFARFFREAPSPVTRVAVSRRLCARHNAARCLRCRIRRAVMDHVARRCLRALVVAVPHGKRSNYSLRAALNADGSAGRLAKVVVDD